MRFSALLCSFLLFSSLRLLSQNGEYSIKHYDTENGLTQNSIKAVEMDCKGFLWFATEMGLIRFDGARFKYYNQQNYSELVSNRVTSLHIDDSCQIKFTAGENYYRITEAGLLNNFIPAANEIADTINNKKFPAKNIGLNFYGKKPPLWAMPNQELLSRSLHNSYTYLNGRYYYFNEKMEIVSFNINSKTFQQCKVTGELKPLLLLNQKEPVSISMLKQGEDLYIRWEKMIYKILIPDAGNTIISQPFLQVDSIPNITFLRVWDKYNMKLVGTLGEGFYLFFKKQFYTRLLPDWESNIFYAQAAFGDNGIITKKAVLLPNTSFTFPSFTSESLLRTTQGVYFASKSLNNNESAIVEFGADLKERKFLKLFDLKINCFRELKNGEIWFSSNRPFLGKIIKEKIEWIPKPPDFPEGAEIKTFIETGENEFLVAGSFGLCKIDLASNTCTNFKDLQGIDVRCLYEDKRGSIFIGTYGNGFYILNNSRIIKLPLDKNGYMYSVHAFVEDKGGYLWMSTNRGLFQVLVKDIYDYIFGFTNSIYYQYYDKDDGFLTNEFNGGCTPSVIRLNNGMVSFPSIKGLVQFIPEKIQPQLPESAIFIEDVKVDGLPISNEGGVFNVSNKAKLIDVSVASPFYGNQYNQDILYKMEGLNDDWLPLDRSGKIQYNRLAAGKYKLLISKQTKFGRTSVTTSEIDFAMQPFLYEKWGFKIISLLSLSTFLLLILAVRFKILRKIKNKLEEDVKEKIVTQDALIKELGLTVNALEKSKNEVEISNALKERLAMIIAHDLQSPLRFLSQVTQNLHTKAVSGENNEVISMSLEIKKSLANIHQFVEEFGLCLRSHQSNFHVRKKMFDISELLGEINIFFADLIKAKGNQLNIEIADENYIYSDRQLLKIILRNLIDNANKHTRNGVINIWVESNENDLTLIIKDNGTGMDNSLVSKLNQQMKETDFVPLLNLVNKGYGYQFIGMFSKVLGLLTEIRSRPGDGTEIRIMNLALFDKKISETSFNYPVIIY